MQITVNQIFTAIKVLSYVILINFGEYRNTTKMVRKYSHHLF